MAKAIRAARSNSAVNHGVTFSAPKQAQEALPAKAWLRLNPNKTANTNKATQRVAAG